MFIFQKDIDLSTLSQGFTIPVAYFPLLEMMPGGFPKIGETRNIKLKINDLEFDAILKNQPFNRKTYAGHADVVQVRYSQNSPIARYLQKVFCHSWNYIQSVRALPENIGGRFNVRIPEDKKESLSFSATDCQNVFIAECLTCEMKESALNVVAGYQCAEYDFESVDMLEDPHAHIKEVKSLHKIRCLDREVGDSLKRLYNFKCQMTGEKIGERYDATVVEAHHLDPFSKSLNNDATNIIILSPTYHRIVHKSNGIWLPQELAFQFPNGLKEKVKINQHL